MTLNVPSVEGAVTWYERVLGWVGHFDTFDEGGCCILRSVMRRDPPELCINLSCSDKIEGVE